MTSEERYAVNREWLRVDARAVDAEKDALRLRKALKEILSLIGTPSDGLHKLKSREYAEVELRVSGSKLRAWHNALNGTEKP